MAKSGGKRTYARDSRGRFASTPGGGKPALKGGTLAKRSSLKSSRAKLAAKDKADPSIRNTLNTRAQKGAVTRGNKALRAAKASSQRTAVGRSKAGTVSKTRRSPVLKTTALKPESARVPAAQRPGSITNTLRGAMAALAKADAQRIREIESITGQKVRPTTAGTKAGKEAGARVRATAKKGKMADTLRAGLRELAQSDARTMRGMAEIVRDATPKVAGGKAGKALKGAKKALPAAKTEPPAPKPPTRAKGSRASLPRTRGTVAKPRGLKPGMLAARKKAAASRSFNKVDISLDGIKKRRQRALAPKNSTYLSQKMEIQSAIVRSAANAIYNRQRRTGKELGVSSDVIRQPIGIMPGLTGSKRTRAMANLENARKRVLRGRKGRR